MTTTSIKTDLVRSILDKLNAYEREQNNWNHSYDCITVIVRDLETVVPGANAIECSLRNGRCALRFINATKSVYGTSIADEKRITTFDKLSRDEQRRVAAFIESLEAIGNVQVFSNSIWYAGMRPASHTKNAMTFNRTADTIELNARLQIVRLDDFTFDTPKGRATVRGWGFLIPGMGFVKFKHDDDAIPYAPCGGRKALESIINDGGFISYDDIEFVNPVFSPSEILIVQYHMMKMKHPDAVLLFRIGDFYETFADDAITVSKITGITLTRRPNEYRTGSIEIAGFPQHALDEYMRKIVRAGKRIAICEQLESPVKTVKRGGK